MIMGLALLGLAGPAWAHTSEFGLDAVAMVPGDDQQIWARVRGAGLVHSTDGGASWEWYCDEAFHGTPGVVYDLDALADERALLAGEGGLYVFGADYGKELIAGPPPDTNMRALHRYGDGWLVGAVSGSLPGIWNCTLEGCAAVVVDPTVLVDSILADGATAWATVHVATSGEAQLWRSADGVTWASVAVWPGDTVNAEAHVLYARGDVLMVWLASRPGPDTPNLVRSTDGGQTWTSVVAFGTSTGIVDIPTLVELSPGNLLLSSATLVVQSSIDEGATWVDLNAAHIEQPALRCVAEEGPYVCGGHFSDGFDLGRVNGFTVDPVACINDLRPAACATVDTAGATCDLYVDALLDRGTIDTGSCTLELAPPPASGGCGAGAAGSAVLAVALAVSGRKTRRG